MIFAKGMIFQSTHSQYHSQQKDHTDNYSHCLEVYEWANWHVAYLCDKGVHKHSEYIDK
jgi:hypothetical protein